MADVAPPPVVVTPVPLVKSRTIQWNAIVAAIGMAFVALPDSLMQIISVLTSNETQTILKFLPEKYRNALTAIVQILGILITLFAAVNGAIRKWHTSAPITGTTADKQPTA